MALRGEGGSVVLEWLAPRGLFVEGDLIRTSIRNQILIPLFAVQLVTVATITLVAAWLAADRVEGQIASRLEGVVEALGRSSFPLTGGVLARMRGLSGAHFATSDEAGRMIESTLPGLTDLPEGLQGLPATSRLQGVGSYPQVEQDGERYFAASIRQGVGSTILILYPEAALRRARWEAILPPLGVGALSLAPMAAVTGFVAHRLGTRLRSIQERVAAIAAGDFRKLGGQENGDEVDELVRSVDEMASRLRQMDQTIRRTERAGVLAQFAAGFAHQLRNAATGARMAVQLHARRCEGSRHDGTLDVALRQLSICEEQVLGLLSADRGFGQTPTWLDASEILEEVAMLVDPACRHLGVGLARNEDPGIRFFADHDGFRAALLNLALNAIEAAGPGGRVELLATSEGCVVRLDVLDDGPGPSAELASSMFEPFVTGKPEGLGLGLVMARKVAEGLGGSLSWCRVGSRTRFRIEVPQGGGEGSS